MARTGSKSKIPVRLARALAGLVLVLVGLLASVLVAVRVYLDPTRLTALVNNELGDRFVGRVSVSAVRWDLPLLISLRGVSVHDAEGAEVLSVESIDARFTLSSLLAAKLRVVPFRIEGASLRLVPPPPGAPSSRGPYTFFDAFAPRTPPPRRQEAEQGKKRSGLSALSRLEVQIADAALASARVELESGTRTLIVEGLSLEKGRFRFHAGGISARAKSRIERAWVTERSPSGLRTLGPFHLVLEDADYARDPRTGVATGRVAGLVLTGLGSRVTAQGRISGLPAHPTGDVIAEARLALADPALVALLPAAVRKLGLAGGVELRAHVTGPMFRPEAQLRLEGNALSLFGLSPVSLALDAHTQGEELVVDALALALPRGAGLDLEATVGGLPFLRRSGLSGGPLQLRHRARLRARRLPLRALGRAFIDPAILPRTLSATLVAEGASVFPLSSMVALRAEVEGLPAALTHGLVNRLDLALQAQLVEGHARIASLRARAEGLAVEVVGRVPFSRAGRLDARVKLVSDRPHSALARLGLPAAMERVELDGVLRGTPASPTASVSFALEGVRGGALEQANVCGQVRFEGTPERYGLRALLEAGSLELAGETVAYGPVRVEGDQSALALSAFRLTPRRGGAVEVEGRIDVQRKTFRAAARIRDVPAAVVRALAPAAPDLAGVVAGTAHAEGPFAEPTASANVLWSGLVIDGEALGDAMLGANLDRKGIAASARLVGDSGKLAVEGRYAFDKPEVDLRVQGVDLALARLPRLAGLDLGLDGRLGVDFSVRGDPASPRVFGALGMRDLAVEGERIGDGHVDLQVSTDAEAQYLVGLSAFDTVRGHARLAPAHGGPLPVAGDVALELAEVDVARLLPHLREAGLAAALSARAELAIGRGGRAITGRVTVPKLEAVLRSERLAALRPIVASYDGRVARLEDFVVEGPSGRFEANGQIGDSVDIRAKGEIPLEVLAPFITALSRLTGRLHVDLRLHGPRDAPGIRGRVQLLERAVLRARGDRRELVLDALDVSLSPSGAHIAALEGRLGSGRFSAQGEVGLSGLTPSGWDVRFDATAISFRTEEILLECDVHVRALGAGRVPRVSGDIGIMRGRFTRRLRLQDFVFTPRDARASARSRGAPPPWLSDLVLDLRATSAGTVDLKVDAQVFRMDAALDANLFIRGTAAAPHIEGRAVTRSGSVWLPAARLEIASATIDFIPTRASELRAQVNVTARGEVLVPASGVYARPVAYDVRLHLRGPPDAMRLDLSSVPNLPQVQVLSLLAVGRIDPSQLFVGGSDEGDRGLPSPLVFVGSQLATQVTRLLERELGRALSLDLKLNTRLSSDSLRFTAEKGWNSRFRLEGQWRRALVDGATATSGRAALYLSNAVFLEGWAQTVSGDYTTSTEWLSEGTSGHLGLKLHLIAP